MIRILLALLVTLSCLASFESFAVDDGLLKKYQEDLSKIESYLNGITNLSASFAQNGSDKKVGGKLFLSRSKSSAGKMRIEYPSEKIVVVANGSVLSYEDVELGEVSLLPTNTTPISFLTRPNISFAAKDVKINSITKNGDQITISLTKENRKDWEFSITFDLNPVKFAKMSVTNELKEVVEVALIDLDFEKVIPKSLFVVKNKSHSLDE